eukprot:g25062.t2
MRCFRHRGAFPQLEGQGFRQLLCALMLDVETPSGIKQAAAFFQDPLLLKGLDLDSACVLHCLPRRAELIIWNPSTVRFVKEDD